MLRVGMCSGWRQISQPKSVQNCQNRQNTILTAPSRNQLTGLTSKCVLFCSGVPVRYAVRKPSRSDLPLYKSYKIILFVLKLLLRYSNDYQSSEYIVNNVFYVRYCARNSRQEVVSVQTDNNFFNEKRDISLYKNNEMTSFPWVF